MFSLPPGRSLVGFERRDLSPSVAGILALLFLLSILSTAVLAGDPDNSRLVQDVVAEGACAISGMSAEQSQMVALQKARAAAIEQAAGVRVASSTLVRDGIVAVDLIRTYSRGFVVKENVEWLPIAQYQDAPNLPPIPEYRVRITADVSIPEKTAVPLGLSAKLNQRVFRHGEKARVEIETRRNSRVAVFNLRADDRIAMVFPTPFEKANTVIAGRSLRFPSDESRVELVMQALPGRERDAEALFVVAVGKDDGIDFSELFEAGNPMSFSSFFDRYARIAPRSEEIILPYVIERSE